LNQEKSDDELLKDVYKQLCERLSQKELEFVEKTPYSGTVAESSDDDDETDSDSPLPPDSYVAEIAKEFRRAIEIPDSMTPERRQTLLEYARLVQLPGMILDGQHRVYGAKLINEYDVRLPIVLLVDTDAAEQAFQFYVVNNKATKLTPTELRGTISTSLTSEEIQLLYTRFKQAGVSADSARWTHLLNNSESSPFVGLIDFGFQKGFLKENVMFQVVNQFMRPPRSLKSVYSSVLEWEDDDYRINLFYKFWATVKSVYPNAWANAVKDAGGQLLMKATMLTLQRYIFSQFAADMPKRSRRGQGSPIANAEEFEQSVKDELFYLPEEFFTRKWNRTDIDTSDGRAMLNEQITKVIQGQGRNIGNMQLFKSSKSDSAS
jgi:DGQHR domain-containing protein